MEVNQVLIKGFLAVYIPPSSMKKLEDNDTDRISVKNRKYDKPTAGTGITKTDSIAYSEG